MSKETDLAWLAGIWDGEGSIFIQVQAKRQMTPTISMDNTDALIIAKAVEVLESMGITVHVNGPTMKKKSTKGVYRIATSRLDYIKIFTELLQPYLQGEKKAKAKLINRFVTSRLERGKQPYNEYEKSLIDVTRSSQTTRETPLAVMI